MSTTSLKKLVFVFLVILFGLWVMRQSTTATAASRLTDGWLLPVDPPLMVPPNQPALAGPGIDINIDQIIASGFTLPVHVTHAGDGSGRLFVVEQDGKIKVINGATVSTFLDITSLVTSPADDPSAYKERGLFSMAFYPQYETNGRFFVYYSDNDGKIHLSRYSVDSSDPNKANPNSALTILTIDHPTYNNHYGGQIEFGPDGYLYIGVGDGGGQNDQLNRGQNVTLLLGKILRINVNNSSPSSPYTIPANNPFADPDDGTRDEIWAIGTRNPWRFSFDRDIGGMYIGDVGQNMWEEIDYMPPGIGGLNFGWRCREGAHNFKTQGCGSLVLTDPITEYDHTVGQSVTGGFVYRGSDYDALQDYYFFADYITGKIWSMKLTGPNSWANPELELTTGLNISSFGEDEDGELYIVDYRPSGKGKIRRIRDLNTLPPNLDTSTKTASTDQADPGEVVTYTIVLRNTGGLTTTTAFLTDTIPAGLTYDNTSLLATSGDVNQSLKPVLHWQGSLASDREITITYRVSVAASSGNFVNQAKVTVAGLNPLTLSDDLAVPRSSSGTTLTDFFLPGTQPTGPSAITASIPNPSECLACHTEPIYGRWRGSMMSHAGRDPLMWAALAVANDDAPNAGDYCLRCHTPKGWFEGRSHPADGSSLQPEDIQAGVACEVCHRMVDPVGGANDQAAGIDPGIRSVIDPALPSNYVGSGMLILDPQERRRGPFSIPTNPEPPHPTYQTDFVGQFSNAVTRSRLCGSCHNVDNPTLSWNNDPPGNAPAQFWPNGNNQAAPSFANEQLFPIERTFEEWKNSAYAQGSGVYAPQFAGAKGDGMVSACQDCHMRRGTGHAAEFGGGDSVFRDCQTTGCLPEHEFFGGNTWVPKLLQDSDWRLKSEDTAELNNTITNARLFLQKAATISATLAVTTTGKIATVRVFNETGHKLPTGYPEGRRMWLNLKAYNSNDQLIYQSGVYDPATGSLTEDAEIKIYEAKLGITPELAAELGRPDVSSGESFHFVLNNVILKDNRIPPRGYTVAGFNKRGLQPIGATYTNGQYWDDTSYLLPAETDWVVATLYYQTSSKDYIDFLRSKGGEDGTSLGQMWDDLKSPPEVVATMTFSEEGPPPTPGNGQLFLPVIMKND